MTQPLQPAEFRHLRLITNPAPPLDEEVVLGDKLLDRESGLVWLVTDITDDGTVIATPDIPHSAHKSYFIGFPFDRAQDSKLRYRLAATGFTSALADRLDAS